jgi:aminoglycoside 3-N-acetyltransferase
MDPERVVTRERITIDLRALGVAPGDLLMTHESVRAIGWVIGGFDEVAHAILDAIGTGGTWMKLIGTADSAYELETYPPEVQRLYRASLPPFDPRRTRAHPAWGVLCEVLRTWPGAVRSHHPDSSFAAVGPLADELMRDAPLDFGYGPGSPLERFLERDGRILLLGSAPSDVTFLHYAEYAAAIPDKRRHRYETPVLGPDGRAVWVKVEELDSSHGIAPYEGDAFEAIVTAFRDGGHGARGKVGHADACLFESRALHAFATRWMEEHLRP